MADAVDAAIAAASTPAEKRVAIPVQIASTGRVIQLNVPADLTDAEALEFLGWFGAILVPKLHQQAVGPKSRLLVPAGALARA